MRLALALGVLILSIGLAVSVGAVSVPLATVWRIAAHHVGGWGVPDWSAGGDSIVWHIRFPRVLLAAIVGAGLAVVGAALQAVTRNPLADPHRLGISSGGAFGAILALMHTGMVLGTLTVPAFAFAGALGATALVLGLSRATRAHSADRLVLAGVAVSFVVMSAANLLVFMGDPRATHTVVFWMLGGLGLAEWSHLAWPLAVLLPAAAWLWLQAPALDAMALGDETAATLGLNPERFRLSVFVASALITGVMVAFSGLIGFVGLMVPHLVRMLLGPSNARLLPGAALGGALVLIWSDTAARLLIAPQDLPVGVVTGFAGGLFFLWLMARRG